MINEGIWMIQRRRAGTAFAKSLGRRAMIIIIESGALYSCSMVILAGTVPELEARRSEVHCADDSDAGLQTQWLRVARAYA